MAKAKVTMHDVARLAGVSISTVSAVINGSAGVSPKRHKRVLDAMEVLDYHPDQIARSLKTGKTNVIGMLIADITNAFYPELMRGVEEAAAKNGYSVIFCNSNENVEQERRGLATLIGRRVDGALIACCDSFSPTYEIVGRRKLPTVFLDRLPTGKSSPGIATDNLKAGLDATRHLVELGHQRIAIIAGRMELSPHVHRVEGFRQAMQEAGLPVRSEYYRTGSLSTETGYERAKELLALNPRPTAIVCTNNKTLLGVVRAFAEFGVVCPDEISLVGFDDFAWTENLKPKLTTVVQPSFRMGQEAFELLLNLMGNTTDVEEQTRWEPRLLPAELRIRESTAPPQNEALRPHANRSEVSMASI